MTLELQKPPRSRGVFCNRTLNMRSIKAIGYDMDYTLVDYHVDRWERRAYERARDKFESLGWPVKGLEFDPDAVIRGLVIDTELGNLVKANRFGFVKKAVHGTRDLNYEEMRDAYMRTMVDLALPRWVFLNTLFSLSEACLFGQLVDMLDARLLPAGMGYRDLYEQVRVTMDAMHVEGELKAEIIASPENYVKLDPELPLALLDQKHAGKKLMLITNSEWSYSCAMMEFAFGQYLDKMRPHSMHWRELFDVVIVAARKPEFFTTRSPFFEVVTDEGLLKPAIGQLKPGVAYLGGSAAQIERHLGISGDEILYVGDHMFGDVHVTKNVLRWRTALILRELEDEIEAIERFQETEQQLAVRMAEKEALEHELAHVRLALQRHRDHYGPQLKVNDRVLHEQSNALRHRLQELDQDIGPIAKAATELANPRWGLLTRAGNDKSHLARQVERYADIYTSRVSNLLYSTPFVYLRSPRGSLPHDPSTPSGPPLVGAGPRGGD